MSPQHATARSFTKRLVLFISLATLSIFLIKGIYVLGMTQAPDGPVVRKIKVRDFKEMPVAVVEVRNLDSGKWYEDLQIELKNVSSKPI
jgi:hypothetical protein